MNEAVKSQRTFSILGELWRGASTRLILLLRIALMAGAVVAIGWSLTISSGKIWGALGAGIGVLAGEVLGRSRLRTWVLLATWVVLSSLLLALSQAFVTWSWPVELLGSQELTAWVESLRWGGMAFLVVALLRGVALRYPSLVLLELLIPLLAAASILSSHRDGNLHRPQWLADRAIEQGQDPIWYLMLFGMAGAVFLAVGLLRIRRTTQFFGGLALLALLFSLFFWISSKPSTIRSLRGSRGGSGGSSQQSKKHMSFQPPPPSSGRQRPVAIAIFEHDYRPRSKIYYFRQRALSRYSGVRLQQAIREDVTKEFVEHFPATGVRVSLPRVPGSRELVRTRISLLSSHVNPFGLVAPQSFVGLPNPNSRLFRRSYAVNSMVWKGKLKLKLPVGSAKWSASLREHYLKAPQEKRYKELLAKILKPLEKTKYRGLTLAKAYMIKLWLEHNGTYSLSVRAPRGVRDQVAHFLFKTRIGYCVHFSHAAVYLMRLAGVPARMAEGYAVPTRHRGSSSSLLIREAEAHAWPEIYVQGIGWVVFDVYPRRTLDQQIPPPDPRLRQMMANLARNQTKQHNRSKKQQIQQEDQKKKKASSVFSWLGLRLLIGLLVLLYLLKFWRRWGYILASQPKRLHLFYRSLEDRLSERGIRREVGETPGYMALRLQEPLPSMQGMVSLMIAQRLGSKMPRLPFRESHELQVLDELRAMSPWTWRVLHFLDPVSWSLHFLARWRYHPPQIWRKSAAVVRKIVRWPGERLRALFPAKPGDAA